MNHIVKIVNGGKAATYAAYALSDVATVYPITPVEEMGEIADEWSMQNLNNVFGHPMAVREMESELGAAGATHGALSGGALATTFTNSQGLMLMIPNMYKMAGELLPAVFHVATRTLSTHALSIFADHQDIMACRQTGFAFLASSSVQECHDLAIVAHLSAIDGSVPFCHFFDGWRTSSEIQKISLLPYDAIKALVNMDKVRYFRNRAMNPEKPVIRGTAQNHDVYFQNRERSNTFYDALPDIVQKNMDKVSAVMSKSYHMFDYVGVTNPDYVIVSMCSSCLVIEEAIEYLNKNGYKVGLINVRLFRPFSARHLIDSIPSSTKVICVLDRSKEPGALGGALFEDVCTALHTNNISTPVISGRYGLASKEFTPSMVKAIFDNMASDDMKKSFTIGIEDDITHLSIPVKEEINTISPSTYQCKFFGMGSDGTVGATQQVVGIIGENTSLYTQAYFLYSAKKSGGYTISELRFGSMPVKSAYLIRKADYIGCNKDVFINKFDVLDGIKENGIFVLNTSWTLDEMNKRMPASIKRVIATQKLKFYTIDAFKIASEVGLGVRINMIMETAFFKLVNIMPLDKMITLLKEKIAKIYISKGDDVVKKNYQAVDKAMNELVEVKYSKEWINALDEPLSEKELPQFVKSVAMPMLSLKGDELPVSLFSADGFTPVGTTKYEKRRVANFIPKWDAEKCIACFQCSFVCPHATIRPVLANAMEMSKAPNSYYVNEKLKEPKFAGLSLRIQVYPEDCQGCGSCVNICPGKALSLQPLEEQLNDEIINLEFSQHISIKNNILPRNTVRGSQLFEPLLEFSGACAGCGETPYVKLMTQLFGERMIIANATGCSSIWGADMPSMPYTVNKNGFGPAWGNSLFEDNSEYGYGIAVAIKQRREELKIYIEQIVKSDSLSLAEKDALNSWLQNADDPLSSAIIGRQIIKIFSQDSSNVLSKKIIDNAHLLGKKSVWAIGGDGWAYDIGFAGLDHVLASGENINLFVMDTECYSNTGGQTSKATPIGAIAQYNSSGKRTNRKRLGQMMMTYENVYVASIAIGANKQQAINSFIEADAYDGPSIVIGYCPCINHGIKKGMGTSIIEEANAVKCGYWPLYRYNPDLKKQGKEPLIVDYVQPDDTLFTYIDGENRYADLQRILPDTAPILRKKLKDYCDDVFNVLTYNSKKK